MNEELMIIVKELADFFKEINFRDPEYRKAIFEYIALSQLEEEYKNERH